MVGSISQLRNASGMGLVSTLLGLAIASVVAGVVSYSVYNMKFAAKSGGSADICSDRASGVLNSLVAQSNKSVVLNWHPIDRDLQPPPHFSTTGQPRLPDGARVVPPPGALVRPQDTNLWALIESSYNWLGQIYNDQAAAGVCSLSGDGLNLTAAALQVLRGNGFNVSPSSVFPREFNEQVFLNLKRVNQLTGAVDCARPIVLVPPSPNAAASFGLRVAVTVRWTGADGQPRSCRRETTVQPDGDRQPPVPTQAPLMVDTLMNPGPGGCDGADGARIPYCKCTNGICMTAPCQPGAGDTECRTLGGPADPNPLYQGFAPKVLRQTIPNRFFVGSASTCARRTTGRSGLHFTVASSEPATLFACGMTRAPLGVTPPPIADHRMCSGFSDGGITGNMNLRSVSPNQPPAVTFEVPDLPVGSYRMSILAIDHAQNFSTREVFASVLDPCPPEHTIQFCAGAPAPNVCGEDNQCVGTKPPNCPNTDFTACQVPMPNDSCGNPCGPGSGPGPTPADVAGVGGYLGPNLDSCGYCTLNGTCVDVIDPNGDGNHSDDIICPRGSCLGARVPVACTTQTPASCPTFEFRPTGSAIPFGQGSYPQRGGSVDIRILGLPGGCTIEYEGHQDQNNSTVGPVSTTTNPDYSTTFTPAGPGNFAGNRPLSMNCGGAISDFEYRSECGAAYGMPDDQCRFLCVQATCR